jgi:Uma2 family endonuclease
MSTLLTSPNVRTLADLLEQLGGIPAERVRCRPALGTATEGDLLEIKRQEKRPCELVDGVVVEKAMGLRESILAIALSNFLRAFVLPRNLGFVTGPDGMLRLAPGLVRIPDVAFVAWARTPNGRIPEEPIPSLAPDLVVEVLSETNTGAEMARKIEEYLAAGVPLIWIVDPVTRTVSAHRGSERSLVFGENDVLSGEEVLPGFELRLRELFSELDRKQ